MLGKMFPAWIERTLNGQDDYAGATFTALLLKASYTFDPTDVFISDLTPASNELTIGAGNYARVTPTGMVISRSGSVTSVTFNAIVFPLLTATGTSAPRSMILAKVVSTDANSPVICQQDFEVTSDVTGADITLTPSPTGLVKYTSSP